MVFNGAAISPASKVHLSDFKWTDSNIFIIVCLLSGVLPSLDSPHEENRRFYFHDQQHHYLSGSHLNIMIPTWGISDGLEHGNHRRPVSVFLDSTVLLHSPIVSVWWLDKKCWNFPRILPARIQIGNYVRAWTCFGVESAGTPIKRRKCKSSSLIGFNRCVYVYWYS